MNKVLKVGIAVTLSAALFAVVILVCLYMTNIIGRNIAPAFNEYDVMPLVRSK